MVVFAFCVLVFFIPLNSRQHSHGSGRPFGMGRRAHHTLIPTTTAAFNGWRAGRSNLDFLSLERPCLARAVWRDRKDYYLLDQHC